MPIYQWSQTDINNQSSDAAINWVEGQAPATVNNSARAMMSQIAKWRDDNNGSLTTGGTGAAYTLTSNQTLVAGFTHTLRVKFNVTNAFQATLAVDALGALPLYANSGSGAAAVLPGIIVPSLPYDITYNGSTWSLIAAFNTPWNVPIGVILPFGGASPPTNFLLCDGSSQLTSQFGALFAVLGYTFGGAGANFNLPDLRGRVAAGLDPTNLRIGAALVTDGGTINGASLGSTGGSQVHTIPVGELPAHAHTLPDLRHTHTYDRFPWLNSAGPVGGGGVTYSASDPNASTASGQASITLNGLSTNNSTAPIAQTAMLQPTIMTNYIIRAI